MESVWSAFAKSPSNAATSAGMVWLSAVCRSAIFGAQPVDPETRLNFHGLRGESVIKPLSVKLVLSSRVPRT